MNRLAHSLMVIVVLAFGGLGSSAQAQLTGGVPGEWLSRYAGARTVGIGGAFVASSEEPFGAMWNPAGLCRMVQNEVHFETTRLFEDTSVHGFSFAMPARTLPSFGLTVVSLRSGDFEKTNDLNETQGSFRESDMAFVLSASKYVHRRVSLGTSVKVVRQSLDEFDAAGLGADFGVLFDVTPTLRVGTSILNVGGPTLSFRSSEESYPVEFRGGFAMRVLSGRGLISAEIDHRNGPGVSLHSGSEYWIHPKMALRVGYSEESAAGGFSYRLSPEMRMDYGVSDHELGVTHRLGVSYRFGGFFATSEADPAVFSPLGEASVTKFELKARTKVEAAEWILGIVDKSDRTVRSFGGKKAPPAHVMWDGKDELGMPLPDGRYHYQLVVIDRYGESTVGNLRTVEISTSGPRGSVPVFVE